ncbi:hypothetical protein E2C01_037523 [Portunus trituberculatus]|uniref:Uncharacterized protein n=1 Tax=Portunus trituberculatus TaxID=210409 RepID=A0A5B7F8C9_PORTR|nr:hypothetical protein [Portunus trituberculatus]
MAYSCPPLPWAAISVLSANRAPMSHNHPMAQQTHCLLPESEQAHSCFRHYNSTSAAPPRDHLTHSDSRLLRVDLLLFDRNDHWALFDSSHPSCSGWQGSQASLFPGPDYAPLCSEEHNWPPLETEGDEGHEFPPHFTSMYHHMMTYIILVFKNAVGQRSYMECPVTLGCSLSTFLMEQANRAYLKPSEKKLSVVGYLLGRFTKVHNMAGQEMYGKADLVNPNLHSTLNPGAQKPSITHEHLEVARMEGVVATYKGREVGP